MPISSQTFKPGTLKSAINFIKENNPGITRLNLSFMRLTNTNIKLLCDALALNTTLTTLDVGHNQIGHEGAQALAQNTTLTTLDVRYNQLGDEGAQALALNKTLTTLYVNSNQIGASNEALIEQQIQHNKRTVIALYVFSTIRNTSSLLVLPLDILYHIATFLVPEKTACKLRLFAEPRFFMRQTITNPFALGGSLDNSGDAEKNGVTKNGHPVNDSPNIKTVNSQKEANHAEQSAGNKTSNDWLKFIYSTLAMQEVQLAVIALGAIILLASSGTGTFLFGGALIIAGATGLAMNYFQPPHKEENNTTPQFGSSASS